MTKIDYPEQYTAAWHWAEDNGKRIISLLSNIDRYMAEAPFKLKSLALFYSNVYVLFTNLRPLINMHLKGYANRMEEFNIKSKEDIQKKLEELGGELNIMLVTNKEKPLIATKIYKGVTQIYGYLLSLLSDLGLLYQIREPVDRSSLYKRRYGAEGVEDGDGTA